MKNTYLSILLTEDYLNGILALTESLKLTNPQYPISILINSNISKNTENLLKSRSLNIIRKPSIPVPNVILERNNQSTTDTYWNYTFEKLNIFSLEEFDKIVYLDSDMFVLKNIDELFEQENMSAVVDKRKDALIHDNWIRLNSGLMVITPKKEIFDALQKGIAILAIKDITCGDQDVIQDYDTNWEDKKQLHLNNTYNIFFPYLDYYVKFEKYSLKDMSVIHFIYRMKPWQETGENRIENYIQKINTKLLNMSKDYHNENQKLSTEIGNENREIILKEYYKILDKAICDY